MRNNKIKIVVDTNIFINGLIFSSDHELDGDVINVLFNLVDKKKIELTFSQDTIGELVYVFKNKVLHYTERKNQLKYMYGIVRLFFQGYSVNTENMKNDTKYKNLKCSDSKDDMFLQCAVQSQAKYLISNDLKSKMKDVTLDSTEVLTAKEFMDMYNTEIGQVTKDEVAEDEVASGKNGENDK